ncbi:hypothetical protein [Chromobacterium sp. IIBBL 290-4]|uniref:hypothetical protein n=1 Tax=Chromobacterium sp. IIBBL 290-4 TaxID=2953890 RepID=UPI0020B8AAFA|nr:hypothetical protein [Chromobacterium sp. IIBBL 290-4]UTH75133.1 hypothetical protein NKT35_03265 [Chromobacterium sp. IIBBL 290-4]
MKMTMKLLPLAISSALMLAACGGSGGSNTSNNSNNTAQGLGQIDGTVATGAPLEDAQLTFKDVNGKTLTKTAGDDGSYRIDLSGFKAPVLVEASGTAGGQNVVLHSVVTQTGTTNVTPLTDAIVAMSVENDPSACFSDNTCLAKLTSDKLDASSANLQTALAPMLNAHGLDGKLDLLHTAFKADKTGQDKLLEMVKVAAGDNPGEVAIHNAFGGDEVIVSRKQKPTAAVKAPSKLPDLTGLDDLARKLTDAYQKEDGLSDRLSPLLSQNFYHNGGTADEYIRVEKDNAKYSAGTIFGRPSILQCDTPENCEVNFSTTYSHTSKNYFNTKVNFENGKWKLAGNGLPTQLIAEPRAYQFKNFRQNQTSSLIGLYIYFSTLNEYDEAFNNLTPSKVNSAQLILNGRVIMSFSNEKDHCGFRGYFLSVPPKMPETQCGPIFPLDETNIQSYNQAVRRGQAKIRLFSDIESQKQVGGDIYLHKPMFTTQEIKHLNFPTIDNESLAKSTDADGNTEVTLDWKIPNGNRFSWLALNMLSDKGESRSEYSSDPSANPVTLNSNKVLSLKNPGYYDISIYSTDKMARVVSTRYYFK